MAKSTSTPDEPEVTATDETVQADTPDGNSDQLVPDNPNSATLAGDNSPEALAQLPEDNPVGDLTVDKDSTVDTTQLGVVPEHGLVTTPDGIDRIVVTDPNSGWRPAPVKADPKEVERIEKIQRELEAQADAKRELLGR